ncbi:hypothetical protein B0H14DRAFT_2591035 [Mycena olivaceomarginata]|nr:hypothetical protein B0H14DRAFT_2591035 [Mycena olivaceomarginata]
MPKPSKKQVAAKERHRKRRGEIDPKELADLQKDGSYIPDVSDAESVAASDDSVTSRASSFLVKRLGNTINTLLRSLPPQLDPDLKPDWEAAEACQALSKKRKAEDADLVQDVPFGKSTSSIYRKKHLKTKKARAAAPKLAKTAHPQEKEKDLDSDVEIISDHASVTEVNAAIESVSNDMVVLFL